MSFLNHIHDRVLSTKSIWPLVTFRVLFGLTLCVTSIRFWNNGWIEKLFIEPDFFFKYNGFEWVLTPDPFWIYAAFAGLIITSLCIALGLFFRPMTALFFVLFSYTELWDATNYLNHHYLVALLALLLLFSPAHKAFSLDALRKPGIQQHRIPALYIYMLRGQVVVLYFFAGLAKVNHDWLFEAMPLRIWLPEHKDLPLIGGLLTLPVTAFVFSWFGAIYDLTIGLWLSLKKARPFAYATVILFHVTTGLLFNIGIFPILMITTNLIFFSGSFHEKIYQRFRSVATVRTARLVAQPHKLFKWGLIVYFGIQVLLPLRHVVYPGNVLVSEEGYRFSWRVMLLEKSGLATFTVRDKTTGRYTEVINSDYLTDFQEKQMAIQPDFMVQYAKHLAHVYQGRIEDPEVTVHAVVSMNGRPSQRFIDEKVDLSAVGYSLKHKNWIQSW